MKPTILLTSFQTWLAHQKSNSSDDLLAAIAKQDFPHQSLTLLRQLPVNISQASSLVISKVKELQPDAVICCGMAESRRKLTIESNARCGNLQLKTSVNLEKLVDNLASTTVSHDAGKFVCEGLYYRVLHYLSRSQLTCPCIFVHIPVLSNENFSDIQRDFSRIVKEVAQIN